MSLEEMNLRQAIEKEAGYFVAPLSLQQKLMGVPQTSRLNTSWMLVAASFFIMMFVSALLVENNQQEFDSLFDPIGVLTASIYFE